MPSRQYRKHPPLPSGVLDRGESVEPAHPPGIHVEKYEGDDSFSDLTAIQRRHPLVYVVPLLLLAVAAGVFFYMSSSDKNSNEQARIDRVDIPDGGANRVEPAMPDAAKGNNGADAMPVMDAGAMPVMDAGATLSKTDGSRVPDLHAKPPVEPINSWSYSGKTPTFNFKVIAPASISTENDVTIEVQIRPIHSELRNAMASNSLRASLKFSHYRNHQHGQTISGRQNKKSMIFVVQFDRNGQHHVNLVLGQKPNTSKARFDVCVGIDRSLCPNMN